MPLLQYRARLDQACVSPRGRVHPYIVCTTRYTCNDSYACVVQIPRAKRNPLAHPSPQYVAQRLLARPPASADTSGRRGFSSCANMQLNLMAGAWIQAMVHDWQARAP